MTRKERYSKLNIERALVGSESVKDIIINMGLRAAGGNYNVIQKYIKLYEIDISHFDPNVGRKKSGAGLRIPIEEILVENSTFCRTHLKARLFKEGYKKPICEMPGCGVGEIWNGRKMSLILDHVNGVHNDNRYHNLRILCPNCNATLDTHCGKHKRVKVEVVVSTPLPKIIKLAPKPKRAKKIIKPNARRVKIRPEPEVLTALIQEHGYSGVGRMYGVSDNAIRKWAKATS